MSGKQERWGGCARAATGGGSTFFLLDVPSGKIESTAAVAGLGRGKLLRTNDGRILSMQGSTVVVLDPATWQVAPAGKLAPLPEKPGANPVPRDWMILGEDLYLFLDTHLARIAGRVH